MGVHRACGWVGETKKSKGPTLSLCHRSFTGKAEHSSATVGRPRRVEECNEVQPVRRDGFDAVEGDAPVEQEADPVRGGWEGNAAVLRAARPPARGQDETTTAAGGCLSKGARRARCR